MFKVRLSFETKIQFCLILDGEGASFDGESRITYDISGTNEYVQTRKDLFKLRFRTNSANGLLFFADSNQGDYVILELVHGKLYLHIDLGLYELGDDTWVIIYDIYKQESVM